MTDTQIAIYKAALKEARASYDDASRREQEIKMESYKLSREMSKLRRTITALAAMCSEDPRLDPLGITDAVMEVMREFDYSVTTNEVVVLLEANGFDIETQKNAAASVHAILNRLAKSGKIKKTDHEKKGIVWRGPNYDEEMDRAMMQAIEEPKEEAGN